MVQETTKMSSPSLLYLDSFPSFSCEEPFFEDFQAPLVSFIQKTWAFSQMQIPSEKVAFRSCFDAWIENLPLFDFHYTKSKPFLLRISLIYSFENTQGVNKYVEDALGRWLIPGKVLPIKGCYQMTFFFDELKERQFRFSEYFLRISDSSSMRRAAANLPKLIQEMRLHILSVYYARQIFSQKDLSREEKNSLIEEYTSSCQSEIDPQIKQQLVYQLSNEEASLRTKKQVNELFQRNSEKTADIFQSTRRYILLFPEGFTVKRNPKHLSRLVAFFHLFQDELSVKKSEKPAERHPQIKVFKTRVQRDKEKKLVLGVLVSINLLSESERFNKRHVMEAFSHIMPDLKYVPGSYILERKHEELIRSVYLELEKPDNQPLSQDELKFIKKSLPKEVLRRVETIFHPIFMPRNDEEIMRNIILLSNQLKFVKDLPQVMISYEDQTNQHIYFHVLIARLVNPKTCSIQKLFEKNTQVTVTQEQKKVLGHLKKKHPKEVHVLRISMDKTTFFRSDYSLDLQKARRTVVKELTKAIGEFRDYNGGMLLKKTEAFDQLKSLLPEIDSRKEFLLENFFYSLRPSVMQTVLSSEILKAVFFGILQGIEKDFAKKEGYLSSFFKEPYFISIVTTTQSSLQKKALNTIKKLGLSHYDLSVCSFTLYELSILAYVYKYPLKKDAELLKKTLEKAIFSTPL